jgi:hypothetical protein
VLLAVGAVVGVAAVVGLVVGFEPSKLPPALLNVAVYKLIFGAAAGLLTAGAVVQRYAARREDRDQSRDTTASPTAAEPAMLGEGSVDSRRQRERDARLGVDIRRDSVDQRIERTSSET